MSGLHEDALNPLTLPVVPSDNRLVGRGVEVFRTPAQPQYAIPAFTSGNDVGSFATLGNYIVLVEDIVVDRLYGAWQNTTIGDQYSMFIATLSSVGDITGTVATALARFTTVATGKQQRSFDITPVTLVAGTRYALCLVNTTGLGTRANGGTGANGVTYPNLPLDIGKMLGDAFATSSGARVWYSQASDAPGAVAKSGSNTGVYGFGLRFYK